MRYYLKPISKENWRKATQLEVAPEQKDFIEDNALSLLEASYDRDHYWTPIGLYVNHEMVGFAMIGLENKTNKEIWFDRFMIDQTHQHQGYGRALFKVVLNYLKDYYKHIDHVNVRVYDENTHAVSFYQSFGFQTIDRHEGDHIMTLTIDRKADQPLKNTTVRIFS